MRLAPFLLLLALLVPISPAFSDTPGWAALRDGRHAALIRHSLAPGVGDPGEFRLGDCDTQRNLSEQGRAQATRLGAAFREQGLEALAVYTSRWCRASETAELMGLGQVRPLPFLDSFFRERANGPARTQALRNFLREGREGDSLVIVSHQVNITALSGVFPGSGEIIVVRMLEDDEIAVVDRIAVP
ncbi:MAG: histidine phosphatase family protein [Ectothiorhodospiraceae bacterium]|nr:histidine phosphatase family protein [Ectothiorhodospiraceae bacterium]MCH8503651.1 histidine phosphatase family protein [Ectothiorhodospiraceae bacterium]